jgi:hypothetical protein
MEIGKRILYNFETGYVLNNSLGEMSGDIREDLRPAEIGIIDLPYGDTTLQDALTYHVDVVTKTIVIDTRREHVTTYEELQQQLLIAEGVI